ncbi:DUF6518 family protein [Streptomyces thermodiastaticus]
MAGGLLLGVLTNLAQGWLPGAWNQIANSGAVWCVAAFAAGALVARHAGLPAATVAGLCAESGLVVGYYGYAEVARGGMGSVLAPLVWLGMACVAGPLFGVAGSWWRCSSTPRRRIIGLAALAGVFGMEGIHYAFILHYAPPRHGPASPSRSPCRCSWATPSGNAHGLSWPPSSSRCWPTSSSYS